MSIHVLLYNDSGDIHDVQLVVIIEQVLHDYIHGIAIFEIFI